MSFRKFLLASFTFLIALLLSLFSYKKNNAQPFHTESELRFFQEHLRDPIDSDQYFLTSTRCKGCHGFDSLHLANIDNDGNDVNLHDDWAATMMANAAIDPLWRAKVSHEILVNPGHSTALQTTCTSCHAPMGHYTAIYHGATEYTIADLETDSLGLNGVACGGCHSIGSQGLGSMFSGNIPYDTNNVEYGPFFDPFYGPMELYVGLVPAFGPHMQEGRVCSSCHTLITHTADLNGNYNANTFVEQATFHEWLNSALAADNVTCQKCHMPEADDSIVIVNEISSLQPRAPFNQHFFVGGNYFMVKLIKDNKAALGVSTADKNFDSTLLATKNLLRDKTLGIQLAADSVSSDTAFLKLTLTNKAGHKFPSGYPARRAVVQILLLDQDADTVFQSGTFNSEFEVKNIDPVFEPHHDVINNPNDILIYEMVMADENNNKTTVLERADHSLKDNRIPPEGFVSTHPAYDTALIVGDALNDPNFNKNGINEGTGKDIVYFHIPISGLNGTVSAFAHIYYQSVPPKWLEEMFSMSSAPIDTFRSMYQAADRTPFLVISDTVTNIPVGINAVSSNEHGLRLLNSLTSSSCTLYNASGLFIYSIEIIGGNGQILATESVKNSVMSIPISLPFPNGIYYINVFTNTGHYVFKAMKMKP